MLGGEYFVNVTQFLEFYKLNPLGTVKLTKQVSNVFVVCFHSLQPHSQCTFFIYKKVKSKGEILKVSYSVSYILKFTGLTGLSNKIAFI